MAPSAVLREVTISNGLQWNRAGDTVFYVDTPTGRVDCFDFDPARRVHQPADLHRDRGRRESGRPGDRRGGRHLGGALGGGAVHRYDRDGRLDLVVDLPVSQVTACTFGGPELRTLFITTSRQGLDPRGRARRRRRVPLRRGRSRRAAARLRRLSLGEIPAHQDDGISERADASLRVSCNRSSRPTRSGASPTGLRTAQRGSPSMSSRTRCTAGALNGTPGPLRGRWPRRGSRGPRRCRPAAHGRRRGAPSRGSGTRMLQ